MMFTDSSAGVRHSIEAARPGRQDMEESDEMEDEELVEEEDALLEEEEDLEDDANESPTR
jgi:hypothetical protein